MGDPKVNKAFAESIKKKHGQTVFENLEIQSRCTWKSSRFELRMIIEQNKIIVNDLLAQKGIEKWW